MDDFQVIVKPSTFEVSQSSALTGQIWMQLGDEAFPEAGWNDLALVIVGWWCQAVSGLPAKTGSECDLRFMDGAFLVAVTRETDGRLCLTARAAGRVVTSVGGCTEELLRQQLVAAGEVVLQYCEQHSLINDDVRTLQRELHGDGADPIAARELAELRGSSA